jgi:hypothetical protein
MKKLIFMVIGLIFTVQTAFGTPISSGMTFSSINKSDSTVLFGKATNSAVILNRSEMQSAEGEFWPIVYGVAWGAARATIWAAGRYGTRWGFRAIRSSNNHRILLHNGRHVLQTGGRRGVSGFRQNASHIGWGRASRSNNSRRHLFYNGRWQVR